MTAARLGARLAHVSALLAATVEAHAPRPAEDHGPRPAAQAAEDAWRDPATWLTPILRSAEGVSRRLDAHAAALDPRGEGGFRAPDLAEYAPPPGALFAPGGPLRPLDLGAAELTRAADLLDTGATAAAQSDVTTAPPGLADELREAVRTLTAGASALHLAATALGELAAHVLHDHGGDGSEGRTDASSPGRRVPPHPTPHPARAVAAAIAPHLDALLPADGGPLAPLPAALPPRPGASAGLGSRSTPTRAADHVRLSPPDLGLAVLAAPELVGNLPGLEWSTRIAANAVSVRRTSQRERLAGRAGTILIGRYDAMDRLRPDPVTGVPSRRRFLAFDPAGPGRMIEVVGEIAEADGLLLYVPGTGTNLEMSHVNTEVGEHFAAYGEGRIAVLVFVGGAFPQDMWSESGDPVFTEAMAPLVARFSWEVQAHLRWIGRTVPVTVVGHSFGGGVVGTAETLGLHAERVAYVASPSAGLGVRSASQWRNTAPTVRRYSLTVPGDPIELMQIRNGLRYPNSSAADIMDGVRRLDTGFAGSGEVLFGTRGHGGVFDAGGDAFRQLAAIVVGAPVVPYVGRSIVAEGTASWRRADGRLLPTAWQQIRAQLWRPRTAPASDGGRPGSRDHPRVVEGPGRLVPGTLGLAGPAGAIASDVPPGR